MRKRAGKSDKQTASAQLQRRRKATMKDVADLAGVSLATVSRTLSAAAEVSPRLSRRVQAAARRLDYAVNINARGLRGKTQRPRRRAAARHRQSILLGAAARHRGTGAQPRHGGADRRHRRRSRDRRDLLASTSSTANAPTASPANGFFSLSAGEMGGRRLPDGRRQRADCRDRRADRRHRNVAAAFDAVSYLARLGHRRVAEIRGPAENVLTKERREGYHKAVEANDLEHWPEAIQPGTFSIRLWGRGDRAAVGSRAVHPPRSSPPTTRSRSARSSRPRRRVCVSPGTCRSSASTISRWGRSAIRR